MFGDAVLSRMVMRDASFDARGFDPEEHVEETRRASDLLDADSTCWDAFIDNGGKAIMYHGTYDQLISGNSTVQYYEALCDRYDREETQGFCRMYLAPGFGHSIGLVDLGMDLLGELDSWVCGGGRPETIVAHERRYDRGDHEYLLCPFPWYSRYVEGDPAKAPSYAMTLDR